MRLMPFVVCLLAFLCCFPQAFAKDETSSYAKDKAAELATQVKAADADISNHIDEAIDGNKDLVDDLKRARDIIMNGTGDNAFLRGLIVALFQPMFLAAMFSLGLWAGQMNQRISTIWVLPIVVFVAIFIGAFITAYHSEWKPTFDGDKSKYLSSLQSTDVVAVVVGLIVGAAVAMRLTLAPLLALGAAVVVGLALGFSQTTELGDHHNSLLPFWAGFGLTGVFINIFGIGFETFLQSIKAEAATRALGFGTVLLSFYFGSQLF